MALSPRAGRTRASKVRQLFWLFVIALAFGSAWADEQAAPRPADASSSGSDNTVPTKPAGQNAPDSSTPAADNAEQASAQTTGYLIRVDLPITGDIDTKVRAAITKIVSDLPKGGPRPVVIIELSAGQIEGGAGSDFSRAWSLAKFLSQDLHNIAPTVKTVAYIPKSIKGHAVLVALACEEIVMAPDAEMGDAGCDETVLSPFVRSGYKEIAEARRTIPANVALAMLDRDLKVYKVVTEVGTEYALEDDFAKIKERHVIQSQEELKPRPFLFDGRRGRELGFVSYLADDRADLARSLKLLAQAVQDNPALVGGWRPVQVDLKRAINAKDISIVQRKIEDQIRENDVNLVVLWIDSDGGSYSDSLRLAGYLAGLKSSQVRTVAYIPRSARGDAALIALACNQIVMNPQAKLGGSGAAVLNKEEIPTTVKVVRDTIEQSNSRSWSLPVAMVDPELKVYRYRQPSTGLVDYFCDDELHQQRDPGSWRQEELVTNPGGALALGGRKAAEMGVVAKLVDNFEQFKQAYGLEKNPAMVEPGWVDYLVDALTTDGARMFLLVMGFVGLYLEIHSPGVGVGAFIALVAFLLYFWAQHLRGTAQVLEVLLFLAGMFCVALEIFVLPGFAIFGLGGGLMIIASLILASQTFIVPANDYQLEQLRNSMLVLGGATLGCILTATVLRRMLPRADAQSHDA